MTVISAETKLTLKQANDILTTTEMQVRCAQDEDTLNAARHARAIAIDAYDAAYDAACSSREAVKYTD